MLLHGTGMAPAVQRRMAVRGLVAVRAAVAAVVAAAGCA